MYPPWRLEGAILEEGKEDAVRVWVAEQEKAGLDVLTDGEQRRQHYIWGFFQGLDGIDTVNLGMRPSARNATARRSSRRAWSASPTIAARSSSMRCAPPRR